MKLPRQTDGFTIVEVMIFLAVSSLILVSATGLFAGRQRQIQYEQGVRDLDFKIAEVINNVTRGHFPTSTYACTEAPDYIDLSEQAVGSVGNGIQGTNDQCVFVGMGIKLDSTDEESVTITPLVAARARLGQPMQLTDAAAKITPAIGLQSGYRTSYGLRLLRLINDSGTPVENVLFLSSLGSGQDIASNLLASGAQSVNLFTSSDIFANDQAISVSRATNPIHICAEHPQNDSIKAAITFGLSQGELTTTVNQDIPTSHPCY